MECCPNRLHEVFGTLCSKLTGVYSVWSWKNSENSEDDGGLAWEVSEGSKDCLSCPYNSLNCSSGQLGRKNQLWFRRDQVHHWSEISVLFGTTDADQLEMKNQLWLGNQHHWAIFWGGFPRVSIQKLWSKESPGYISCWTATLPNEKVVGLSGVVRVSFKGKEYSLPWLVPITASRNHTVSTKRCSMYSPWGFLMPSCPGQIRGGQGWRCWLTFSGGSSGSAGSHSGQEAAASGPHGQLPASHPHWRFLQRVYNQQYWTPTVRWVLGSLISLSLLQKGHLTTSYSLKYSFTQFPCIPSHSRRSWLIIH